MKKAIVLLSGGLDSSTALYLAKSQGFDEIYAITFEYGQKHDKELKSAIAIAKAAGVKEHKIVNLLFPVERERICCFCRFGPASTDCRISFAYLLVCYAQICPERLNCKWGFSLGGK